MLFWRAQKIDDLLEFVLGLVDAGDISESHFSIGFKIDLGFTLSERHQTAHALFFRKLAYEKHPDQKKDENRGNPRHEILEPAAFDHTSKGDIVLRQYFDEFWVDPHRTKGLGTTDRRKTERPFDDVLVDRDGPDLTVFEPLFELAVGNALNRILLGPPILKRQQRG